MKTRDKIQKAFNELSEKSSDGGVRPEDLVKYAKPKDSPLHEHFEWDNKKAGQTYRVHQARQLIGKLRVEVEGENVKQFHSIVLEVEEGKESKYFSLEKILTDKDLKSKALKQMVKDIKFFIKKYETHKELFEIVNTDKVDEYHKQYLD